VITDFLRRPKVGFAEAEAQHIRSTGDLNFWLVGPEERVVNDLEGNPVSSIGYPSHRGFSQG
jgi:hypothetical protein